MPSVLIVDDEPNIRRMVGALLGAEGYEVRDAQDGVSGLQRALESEPDVLLLDLMMPGDMDGMATLAQVREKLPDVPVVMMSGRAGLSDAVRATKLGAFNFLEKPLSPEGVLLALSSALELRQVRREAKTLRREIGLSGDMIGDSTAMGKVRELIARVAPTDSRVLITGESGTGKELVAAAIHGASARRDRPFIRVNCAAIPRDLVESEMFGHVHRRDRSTHRTIRAGPHGHAAARRGRRPGTGSTGEAAQGDRGQRDRARRWREADSNRCAHPFGDEQRSRKMRARGHVPRRSLLSSERHSDSASSSSRAAERHTSARTSFLRATPNADGSATTRVERWRDGLIDAASLARQCAGACEHRRTARNSSCGVTGGGGGRQSSPFHRRRWPTRKCTRRSATRSVGTRRIAKRDVGRVRENAHHARVVGSRGQRGGGGAKAQDGSSQFVPSNETARYFDRRGRVMSERHGSLVVPGGQQEHQFDRARVVNSFPR